MSVLCKVIRKAFRGAAKTGRRIYPGEEVTLTAAEAAELRPGSPFQPIGAALSGSSEGDSGNPDTDEAPTVAEIRAMSWLTRHKALYELTGRRPKNKAEAEAMLKALENKGRESAAE
jgi:hypothetical protein